MGELLKDEKLEIADIDTYLHYNKNALMVNSQWVRDWEIENERGQKMNVTIFNDTDETISSEQCKITKIEVKQEDKPLDITFISGKIMVGMDIAMMIETMGEASGEKEEDGVKIYWWNWIPYQNDNWELYVCAKTNVETGEIIGLSFSTID